MGVLGVDDGEVSRLEIDVARRSVVVEDEVILHVEGRTWTLAAVGAAPADALTSLQEDMDVEVGLMGLQRLVGLEDGRRLDVVDEERVALQLDAAELGMQEVVLLDVGEDACEEGVERLVAGAILECT